MDNSLMKSGLTEKGIKQIQEVFEDHSKVDIVLLFGSRAKGNYREGSDIDLAIKGRKLTHEDILRIGVQLEELNLPYKIDLLNYHTINELALVEHIDRVGVVFYERWKRVKLGKVLEIKYGKDHKFLNSGTIPVYGSGGIMRYGDQALYDQESILIPRKGSLNNIFYKEEPFWTVDTMFWTRINHEVAFPKFLYYQLTSIDYSNLNVGSAVPSLTVSVLNEISVVLPPLNEQKAIASVLGSLEYKIDLLCRQNKTLEELAKTCFEKYVSENEDWDEGVVGDLLKLQRGFDLPVQNRVQGQYPIITSSGFNGYHYTYKIKGPGVTTGRSGLLGNVFYVTENFWPLNTSLFVVDFIRVSPLWAYFFLKTLDLASLNGGSAVPTLNRNDVHSIPAKIPPSNIVKEFDAMANPLFNKIKINGIQISSLTQTRDRLLPKLMSGEARIKI